MKLYNPILKEIKTKDELQNKYNSSIPSNISFVKLQSDIWYVLDESHLVPDTYNSETQQLSEMQVRKVNNTYRLEYTVTDKTQEEIESKQISKNTQELESNLEQLKSMYLQAQIIGDTETMTEISNTTKELLGIS